MEENKKYKVTFRKDGELEEVDFETSDDPIEYVWNLFGMSTYIASLEIIEEKIWGVLYD